MPRFGRSHVYFLHNKEKDVVDGPPARKRSVSRPSLSLMPVPSSTSLMLFSPVLSQAPHIHHDLKHIFGCCFRREKPYTEPIPTATIQPQLRPSIVAPHTYTAWETPLNEVDSLYSNYTPIAFPPLDPASSDFIYDILLQPGGNEIRRLMVLDFRTDVNIMSERVFQRLHTKAAYCDPSKTLQVAGMGTVTPLGSVEVKWTIWADHTVYTTRFYVVKGCRVDLLLGRPSVIEHQLSAKDPAVGARIRSSYQGS